MVEDVNMSQSQKKWDPHQIAKHVAFARGVAPSDPRGTQVGREPDILETNPLGTPIGESALKGKRTMASR